MSAPQIVRIKRDNYQAKHVGRTAGGRQFFLTAPFVPLERDFVALYLFDADGNLLEFRIDDLGAREEFNDERGREIVASRLEGLGEIAFGNIAIKPFSVERFGIEFGLILEAPTDDEGQWSATFEPGDYMAFYPPWNGDYDT